jgi:hypothetical protein
MFRGRAPANPEFNGEVTNTFPVVVASHEQLDLISWQSSREAGHLARFAYGAV